MVSIGIDRKIKVVEHLFSALYGLDLFKVKIEASGGECPIFDGSSIEYARKLWDFACDHTPILTVDCPVNVVSGDSFLNFTPDRDRLLTIEVEFFHPYIGTQQLRIRLDRETYLREIAPARTFVFTTEDDERLKNLPPYGIGVTSNKVYSREPLRFADELIRHKTLDLLGDLFLAGGKLCGRIKARNTFHQLNHEFVNAIRRSVHQSS